MNSMLKKYDLILHQDFSKQLINNKVGLNILSDFLSMWRDPEDIKEIVLSDIDAVLNGEVEIIDDLDADVVGVAFIDKQNTYLGNSDIGYKDMTLPTEDFKQLWLEWIDILESSNN